MTGFHSQSVKSNTSLSKQYKSMPDATVTYVIFTDSETKINASHRHFNLHFILVIRIFLPYPLPTVSRLVKKKKIKKNQKRIRAKSTWGTTQPHFHVCILQEDCDMGTQHGLI